MLSALLNSIQSTLGSRGFLVGAVFPVLIFTLVNGLWAFRASPALRSWIVSLDSVTEQTLLGTSLVAGIVVASYVLSAVASGLLEVFEGRRWPVSWFRGPLHRLQLAKIRRLKTEYFECVINLGEVEEGISSRSGPGWIEALERGRRAYGPKIEGKLYYPTSAIDRWFWPKGEPEMGVPAMREVRRLREQGHGIPRGQLQAAVDGLLRVLDRYPHNLPTAEGKAVGLDCDYLTEAIRFSRDRYQAERLRLFNLRKFRFPVDATAGTSRSAIVLAPTTLGNISRTMHSYAQSHYGLDLDVLWTRLQNATRSSESFYTSLQDAKVQLDFFTACAWLAWTSTIVWLALELAVFRSTSGFILAGAVGPAIAIGSYMLACRAYSVFADVMRTGIDLFRFKVLSDLHLPLPAGLEEEWMVWQDLANVMGYLNLRREPGGSISITYKHPA